MLLISSTREVSQSRASSFTMSHQENILLISVTLEVSLPSRSRSSSFAQPRNMLLMEVVFSVWRAPVK